MNQENIINSLKKEYGEAVSYEMLGDDVISFKIKGTDLDWFSHEYCFPNLRNLDLKRNNIRLLSRNIKNLKKLNQLDLGANKLKNLPLEICSLRNLRELNISANLLSTIPENIGTLVNLNTLNLAHNSIIELPEEVGFLYNLESLNLAGNQLKALPASLCNLKGLKHLILNGNPLPAPFPELMARGTRAVLTYLQSLKDGVPQYEARVLLVGEGNVGKSCLVDALDEKPFISNRPTTHGIQLGQISIPHPSVGNQNIVLNTWDFGGQELYRITNQFFYSKRALYLLVWRPREGMEENAVEAWLDRIKLRVSIRDAKVIIISTYAEERRPDLDIPGLKAKFGEMIVGFYEVDNSTGLGLSELRAAIGQFASMLPQMGSLINQKWVAVQEKIQKLSRPYLLKSEYEQICKSEGLNKQTSLTLADLLHDLGRLIYYSDVDGLQKVFILQPEWLTRAISFVLEDRHTIVQKGVLDHSRLKGIWNDANKEKSMRYSDKLHPFFLRLMEQFDLSYRYEDGSQSLVSQMVPFEKPNIPEFSKELPLLTVVFEFDAEAPGLIPWLIVRTHRFSTNTHWRRGVYLRYQDDNALIELDARSRKLSITVSGRAPEFFFHLLVDSVLHVLGRWPGLHWEQLVPCRSAECSEDFFGGRFKVSTLRMAREKKRKTYPCDVCLKNANVSELLTGFRIDDNANLSEIFNRLNQLAENTELIAKEILSVSQVLDFMRLMFKTHNNEKRNGPGLFTLWPKEPVNLFQKLNPSRLFVTTYEMWIWCDYLNEPHPVKKYDVKENQQWVKAIAPYIVGVANVLKVALPLLGLGMERFGPDSWKGKVKDNLEKFSQFSSIVSGVFDLSKELKLPETFELLDAYGAGLRAFHSILQKVDLSSHWGGLRRVMDSAGDLYWVCPHHYRTYDPGLPQLPYVKNKDAESL